MERIHFAQYVLNNIRQHGAKTANAGGFSDGYIWVNSDRPLTERFSYADRNDRDDWAMNVNCEFFGLYKHVWIMRAGKDYIKVPKDLRQEVIAEWKKLEADLKARNKAKAEAEKVRKENAQWWP
jgi:hypothetical protein